MSIMHDHELLEEAKGLLDEALPFIEALNSVQIAVRDLAVNEVADLKQRIHIFLKKV